MAIPPCLVFSGKFKIFQTHFKWHRLQEVGSVFPRTKKSSALRGHPFYMCVHVHLLMHALLLSISRCPSVDMSSPSAATMVLPAASNSRTGPIAEHAGIPLQKCQVKGSPAGHRAFRGHFRCQVVNPVSRQGLQLHLPKEAVGLDAVLLSTSPSVITLRLSCPFPR